MRKQRERTPGRSGAEAVGDRSGADGPTRAQTDGLTVTLLFPRSIILDVNAEGKIAVLNGDRTMTTEISSTPAGIA